LFKYLEGDPHPSIALVDQKTTTTPSTILRGLTHGKTIDAERSTRVRWKQSSRA
jgi:hypothetical protein